MAFHKHRDPGNEGAKPHKQPRPQHHSWKPHRDWRVWIALLLIAVMLGYVITDSEAIVPGMPAGQPMPEMNAP